jgi:hypothetical protein
MNIAKEGCGGASLTSTWVSLKVTLQDLQTTFEARNRSDYTYLATFIQI